MEKSFIAYIENSIKNNWDLDALTDYKEPPFSIKTLLEKSKNSISSLKKAESARETKSPFAAETVPIGESLSSPH